MKSDIDKEENLILEENDVIDKEDKDEKLLKDKIVNSEEDDTFIPHKKKFKPFENDPYLDSNIFSRFFLYWGYKVLKISKSTKIKKEHLGKYYQFQIR